MALVGSKSTHALQTHRVTFPGIFAFQSAFHKGLKGSPTEEEERRLPSVGNYGCLSVNYDFNTNNIYVYANYSNKTENIFVQISNVLITITIEERIYILITIVRKELRMQRLT